MKSKIKITTNSLDLPGKIEELLAKYWGQNIFHEIVNKHRKQFLELSILPKNDKSS